MVSVGITLQPEREYLDRLAPIFPHADFFEVAPETLWRWDASGEFEPNDYHAEFLDLAHWLGKPVVAHGVGLSLGTVDPEDEVRLDRWLHRIASDHAAFDFAWYTDHLGASVLAGESVALPLPLPRNPTMVDVVRTRLRALREIVPVVGFENSVFYFLFGSWLDEPAFFDAILQEPGAHLLLDLHNVYTMGLNFGIDPADYLARLDLNHVLEIHLSGGSRSDPEWLPSGRTLRLDSHDDAVPESVWRLFAEVAPRCPNLRGVCIERMEGTVGAEDATWIGAELERARALLHG